MDPFYQCERSRVFLEASRRVEKRCASPCGPSFGRRRSFHRPGFEGFSSQSRSCPSRIFGGRLKQNVFGGGRERKKDSIATRKRGKGGMGRDLSGSRGSGGNRNRLRKPDS